MQEFSSDHNDHRFNIRLNTFFINYSQIFNPVQHVKKLKSVLISYTKEKISVLKVMFNCS